MSYEYKDGDTVIRGSRLALKLTESDSDTVLLVDEEGKIQAEISVPSLIEGVAIAADEVTATVDGTGDGVIEERINFVTVTSANAAHLVTLPDPVPGLTLTIKNGGTAFELQSSDPETVAINGGTAESASSTVAANRTLVARCVSETAWIVSQYTEDATESKLDAASA